MSRFCHYFLQAAAACWGWRATAHPEGKDSLSWRKDGKMKVLQSTGRGGGGGQRWNQGVLGCVKNVLPGKSGKTQGFPWAAGTLWVGLSTQINSV